MKSINVLKSVELSNIKHLLNRLNALGICTDEDVQFLSSKIIKGWDDSCTDFLIEHGLNEMKLEKHAKFYEGFGSVYVLFNDSVYDYKTATEHMDDEVRVSQLIDLELL